MNQIIGGTTIRLHQDDNVVVAAQNIGAGATIPGEGVVTASPVPSGHKIATRAIAAGDYVRKYNQIIGVATADIAPGDHVHVQNCAMSEFERSLSPRALPDEGASPTDAKPRVAVIFGGRSSEHAVSCSTAGR